MNNQTIDGVPRRMLEEIAVLLYRVKCTPLEQELRALLDSPAVEVRDRCGVQMVNCPECAHQWDHFFECGNKEVAQPQDDMVAVVLSAEELRFLETIALNPGAKLNGGIAWNTEGDPMWDHLEGLGLIKCVGGYKWKLAFNAVELGANTFLGQQPGQVAVVLPDPVKVLHRFEDDSISQAQAQGWNAFLDEVTRLNTKQL